MTGFFQEQSGQDRRALGSAQLNVGHAGAAAGLAGVIKAVCCLDRRLLPPWSDAADPDETLTPIGRPLPATQYWLRNRADGPRRAGVTVLSVDGNALHVVLEEGPEHEAVSTAIQAGRGRPLEEGLFIVEGDGVELERGLSDLDRHLRSSSVDDIFQAARAWRREHGPRPQAPLGLALTAANRDEALRQVETARQRLQNGAAATAPGDRVFFEPKPLGPSAELAFVFPGSGNHFPGMGQDVSTTWPGVFQRLDRENLRLADQFVPEVFWSSARPDRVPNAREAIFGQVCLGATMADTLALFGVKPDAAIGYSLGESAALFALRAWTNRDEMLERMLASTLFSTDLAGPCDAARQAWDLASDEEVNWAAGVVDRPAEAVKEALQGRSRVYLLIINTPDECVVGGQRREVESLVNDLDCRYWPLSGVSTVHCEVVGRVEAAYRALHLFPTAPPPGIRFYSAARGRAYKPTSEEAADSITQQALGVMDFQRLIENAYADGVRLFVEMGPGSSAGRMIGSILKGKPHLARSVCMAGGSAVSAVLKTLGHLAAHRIPVDLEPMFGGRDRLEVGPEKKAPAVVLKTDHPAFAPPPLPNKPTVHRDETAPTLEPVRAGWASEALTDLERLIDRASAGLAATGEAHARFLEVAADLDRLAGETVRRQMDTAQALAAGGPRADASFPAPSPPPAPAQARPAKKVFLDRSQCLEFAVGSISRVLGPEFAPIDRHPTRVRLPAEPLMLVDRIVAVEAAPRSMTSGRVVTEHDVLEAAPGIWTTAGFRPVSPSRPGRPTCSCRVT